MGKFRELFHKGACLPFLTKPRATSNDDDGKVYDGKVNDDDDKFSDTDTKVNVNDDEFNDNDDKFHANDGKFHANDSKVNDNDAKANVNDGKVNDNDARVNDNDGKVSVNIFTGLNGEKVVTVNNGASLQSQGAFFTSRAVFGLQANGATFGHTSSGTHYVNTGNSSNGLVVCVGPGVEGICQASNRI